MILPALHHAAVPVSERAIEVAYPIGDLVLLAMAILLIRSNGPRGGSAPRWIVATIGLYLAGDWAGVVVGLHAGWSDLGAVGRGIDIAYIVSLACAGFAARHPDIRADGPGAAAVFRLGRDRSETSDDLVRRADAALCAGKASGRDRVIAAPVPFMSWPAAQVGSP